MCLQRRLQTLNPGQSTSYLLASITIYSRVRIVSVFVWDAGQPGIKEMLLSLSQFGVRILSTPDEVAPFADQVQAAADANRDALGFLPERVYKEAAEQGKLLIAAVQNDQGLVYAGHLLHGGVFPHAKVFQLFTAPQFRRQGIGRRLVEALVRRAESLQFISVVAQVADDLTANRFWERLSFEIVRTRLGGRTTGRHINVRIRELTTPTLFSLAAPLSRPSIQDLKLISRLFDVSPIYALDLNILYDLVKRRDNVNDVGRIIRASFNNLVRLAVTQEFISELERTSSPSPTDPILELALKLPRLPPPPPERLTQLTTELGSVIFGNDLSGHKLRMQDASDLVHLATAIHNGASGFITGEKAILRGRSTLQSRYSLDVIGASEFANVVEPLDLAAAPDIQAVASGQVLQGRPITQNDLPAIQAFLGRMRCPERLVQDILGSVPVRRYRKLAVIREGAVVAFGSWEMPSALRPQVHAFLCVDEDHSSVAIAADFLLDSISKESVFDHPTHLTLQLLPGHVATRRIALAQGFRPPANESDSSTKLQKISLRIGVTPTNWARVCHELKKGMGVELPASIPRYKSLEQMVSIIGPTGQLLNLPLWEIESLLSPAIFFLPDRAAVIVPIRKVHAANLIGGDKQLSILPSPEAVLLRERIYFSNPRTAGVLTKGTPILFYESSRKGGRASATAAARIVRAELVSKDGANQELLRRGVLDKKGLKNICLAQTVVATTIDNIMLFKNPVPFTRLRSLGAVDGANLVTARLLNSEQVIQIVEEGMF